MSAHLDNRAVVCHRFSRTPASRRGGFTLAEILVAITVIAILAGLLTPVIIRSLQTAQEATITIEMQQMELAIQQFHSEHGFYPPTIGPGAEIDTNDPTGPQIMLRYLNRMAPNHQENNLAFGFGTGDTRLQDWWDEVGIHMDTRSSLVFWLNGLFKNKQFPLTGGATATAPMVAFNQDLNGWTTSSVVDMRGMFLNATAFAPVTLTQWDVARVTRMDFMFAAAPAMLVGLWNTGFQANTAMTAMGIESVSGWRGLLVACRYWR